MAISWAFSPACSRFALVCLAVLAVTACSSGPPRRGGGPGGFGGGGFGGRGGDGGRSAPPVALLFTGMDANHDLVIDAAELTAAIPIEFARADRDHDGNISAQEMEDWGRAALGDPEQLPNRMTFDVDLNGVVSKAEFEKGLQIEFAKLDKNGDGRIERSEMLNQSRGFAGPGNDDIGGGGGQRGGGGGGPGGGGGGGRGRRGGGGGGNFPG